MIMEECERDNTKQEGHGVLSCAHGEYDITDELVKRRVA
jgi:hypothetical protein